ncbi:site-specific integrase [Novosphingobium sp. MMS21-SN21R]|uniref:tyrosine-type recombinase/integrase n=1 Tax=Novosphingobium sp. MMS21-SN21R TaxID=2969298 RepID=UPI00288824BC|nr:site-specific integrase [Novosphingobium sp. MMS21-SN21R]MDT0506921.1 site-specific integrase [Novosphingobium sp. MMS21-SN21R]
MKTCNHHLPKQTVHERDWHYTGIKRAKVLSEAQINQVTDHIRRVSNSPLSDELKFLLSAYAGLRACEIAGLMVDALIVSNEPGGSHIVVARNLAKGGRERMIPMHPKILECFKRFRLAHPTIPFVSFSARGRIRRQSAAAVKTWFLTLYQDLGLQGCSSHSGRRTFITGLARSANRHGSSMRDVQLLAGHARLETTAAYIEPAQNLSRLVAALGTE